VARGAELAYKIELTIGEDTMPQARRTIRLFVSSTFSDMKAEREVLQTDVFPRLRQLCLSNGLRLQPIDLRWGMPEEAASPTTPPSPRWPLPRTTASSLATTSAASTFRTWRPNDPDKPSLSPVHEPAIAVCGTE
jgi:hypothetical protein